MYTGHIYAHRSVHSPRFDTQGASEVPYAEAPRRGREGKGTGAPEILPGAWGFVAFSFAPPEGPKGSHVPGQQDPARLPGTPVLGALVAGRPGAFFLTTLEGPHGS